MDILKEIKKLKFPLDSYVVVGSGPMAAHGLKEIHDIDIVITPKLFEQCKQTGWEQICWTYPEKTDEIFLRRSAVELYLDVNCGDFNPTTEELMQRAEVVNGIPFASLEDIMSFKIECVKTKPKHLRDIELIQKYFDSLGGKL